MNIESVNWIRHILHKLSCAFQGAYNLILGTCLSQVRKGSISDNTFCNPCRLRKTECLSFFNELWQKKKNWFQLVNFSNATQQQWLTHTHSCSHIPTSLYIYLTCEDYNKSICSSFGVLSVIAIWMWMNINSHKLEHYTKAIK